MARNVFLGATRQALEPDGDVAPQHKCRIGARRRYLDVHRLITIRVTPPSVDLLRRTMMSAAVQHGCGVANHRGERKQSPRWSFKVHGGDARQTNG